VSERAAASQVALACVALAAFRGAMPDEKTLSVNTRIAIYMSCWYATSGMTLFGNKHIMSTLGCDPNVLAMSQMICTASFGALKMYGPRLFGVGKEVTPHQTSQSLNKFMCDMVLVGAMRFATVMLGLLSLKFVAVSFTETVKSSAPFFTVIFARLMLGERTSLMVNLALVPVVGGLALCSATELSFNYIGFFSAVANNCAHSRTPLPLFRVYRLPCAPSSSSAKVPRPRLRHPLPVTLPPPSPRHLAATPSPRRHPATTLAPLAGIDCVQNVFSKKLLSTHYNFINLQARPDAASTRPAVARACPSHCRRHLAARRPVPPAARRVGCSFTRRRRR
jgi:hypothetical protein